MGNEGVSSNETNMPELESAMEVLTRVDLDLAYSAEKLVNLDILLLKALAFENDFETSPPEDNTEKALEYDYLSGILDSEIRELDNFLDTLQERIVNAHKNISLCGELGELFNVLEEKFHDSEKWLKELQGKILAMKLQASNLQRNSLAFGQRKCFSQNGQIHNTNAELKMESAEQQRYILRMLEQSLARELRLERKLLESKQEEEELKLKLHFKEKVVFFMEEDAEVVWEKLFTAENAVAVLMGTSKEFVGRLQILQFNLNGSIHRERELESKLQYYIEQLKSKETSLQKLERSASKAEVTSIRDDVEVINLRERVKLLEEKLKNVILSNEANQEEISEMVIIIDSMRESFAIAESRAEDAEAKLTLSTETNLELSEELSFLKGSDSNAEKLSLLESKARELEIQLQHAKASSEASQEQQNMLYSAIWDMETLIEDLKSKVAKAENKIEITEDQCLLLSETNLELNKEVNFLRSRTVCLEETLVEANNEKLRSAKDIGVRTEFIMDMVMKLAVERERIQNQLCSLANENKILVEKLEKIKRNSSAIICNDATLRETPEEVLTTS